MEAHNAQHDKPARQAKILVVDDEAAVCAYMVDVLSDLGYQVWQATSGAAALRLAAEHGPDLVLLDIIMPGMSGIEVCKKLREGPQTHHPHVIMISGAGGGAPLEESVIAGADDFLQKPIDALELGIRVRSLLRVRNIHDEEKRLEAYVQNLQDLRAQKHA